MTTKRKPYKCGKCRQTGHTAARCQASENPKLSPPEALRVMVPGEVAIMLILAGEVASAAMTAGEHVETALGRTMLAAYSELFRRVRGVSPESLAAARIAKDALDKARATYERALAPIKAVLP